MIGIPEIALAALITAGLLLGAAFNGWLRFETLAAGLVGLAVGVLATVNVIGSY